MSTPSPPRPRPAELPPPPAGGSPPAGGPPRRGPRRRWFGRGGDSGGGGPRQRVRKLRLFLILFGLAILALVSTAYGMMLAVASDVPLIENQQEYRGGLGHNSYLYDDRWRPIGVFAAPTPEVIDSWQRISPAIINAVIAVEDKRFWSSPGVDLKGIARAFVSDVTGGATQGASTITEQFVKNALQQQGNRTILEKLREAALAFHLTHKWKRTRILTQYLNSVYFGNGAYGIESAARVYFGKQLGYDPSAPGDGNVTACGDETIAVKLQSCAKRLNYWQAAQLAGMISDPTLFNPLVNRKLSKERRNLVLLDMLQQHLITRAKYENGIVQPVPTASDLEPPSEPPAAPYFTSWLRPQILRAVGVRPGDTPQQLQAAEYKAYYGGLKIRTTLDLKMQQAADQAVSAELPYLGPDSAVASMVAIDNRTGEVRAMVGGPIVNGQEDYSKYPFNLATDAERQPGSSFKPFTLAVALEHGFGPSSLFVSAPLDIVVPGSGGKEIFRVRNFGNSYSGVISLQGATDASDNSVFERLGWQALGPIKGVHEIKALAQAAGIQTPISTNPSMILGGLTIGVSPLEMAHAYETFAEGGRRVFDPELGSSGEGPTGIAEIRGGGQTVTDVPTYRRVMPAAVAAEVHNMLAGVVQSGTGTAAAISGVDVVGKTGTTTNYADAWFVGWTPQLTTAVWVGFPNKLVPMTTLFNGGPVEGGTYPALIWHAFMAQALQILASEQPVGKNTGTTGPTSTSTLPSLSTPTNGPATSTTTGGTNPPATGNNPAGQGGGTANGGGQGTPAAPAPPAGNGTGAGAGAGGGGNAGTGAGGGTAGGGTGAGTGGSGSGSGGAGIGGGH